MYTITKNLMAPLKQASFRIHVGEQLNYPSVQYVASKTMIYYQFLVLLSTHIVVLEKDGATIQDMRDLFETGFALGKKINRIPLIRGMQFGYGIIPVIVGKEPDPDLLFFAATQPILKFSLFGLPVVIDITQSDMGFFEGKKFMGGMAWLMLQGVVFDQIKPLVDQMDDESRSNAVSE